MSNAVAKLKKDAPPSATFDSLPKKVSYHVDGLPGNAEQDRAHDARLAFNTDNTPAEAVGAMSLFVSRPSGRLPGLRKPCKDNGRYYVSNEKFFFDNDNSKSSN